MANKGIDASRGIEAGVQSVAHATSTAAEGAPLNILSRGVVTKILSVPDGWSLIAYLCLGYPKEEHIDPELQRYGWQDRIDVSSFILER